MASQALVAPIRDRELPLESQTPTVLVVDADQQCIAQCARMLDDLNYNHQCVTSARDALEQIERDGSIQIVMASMHLPSIDGFVLIEEARARIGQTRPLAAVLMAESVSADLAIRGMHVEAVDLINKPIKFEAYSGALRRAMHYLGARRSMSDGANMNDFSKQLARLVSVIETKSPEPREEAPLTDKEIGATLRLIISSRSLRNRFFQSHIFADPAWDILLDLTRAKLDGQQVSVSSVCIAASVPMSTALRWVRQMTEAGLLKRWTDPKDRRRDLIALTESTETQMREYLTMIYGMMINL